MDPFITQTSKLRKKGLPTLSLIAGIAIGVFLYQTAGRLTTQNVTEREVAPRSALTKDEITNIEIFERAAPAVAFITTKKEQWYLYGYRRKETPQGTGSGFVWDKKGHVVTNFHVVQGGDSFEVVLHDQSVYDARIVGLYPDKDLAVLRIDAPSSKLKPLPVGTTEGLKVGQKVLAIGNPFGLDHTLTVGVVSALNRTLDSFRNRQIEGVIQTDAAINPGNSGGPLLDSSGRLIGVNTQIYSTSGSSAGIGFSIPVDTVNQVVTQLIKYGKVIRPGLGIFLAARNDAIMRQLGVEGILIRETQAGGSADRAGLKGVFWRRDGTPILGDIITEVNDEKVSSEKDLATVLDRYKVGDEIEVTFIRDGKLMKTKLVLQAID